LGTPDVQHTKKITSKSHFEKIFRANYGKMCSYANNFLKDPDASEEVVEEVFFRLWINREAIIINSSVESYLFRAVRNASLNVLKHINIREEYKQFNESDRKNSNHTEEELLAGELQQKIRNAIDLLPSERKKIFILSRYEGLKYKEIAEKLNISVSTVENQMVHALKFLRSELKEYLPLIIICLMDSFFK
jgi:RNA polymerase sigma-70 factor (ECF subfamily)